MMIRNEELFRAVADQIEAQPETYNQKAFYERSACGTTGCVAGWAVVIGAYEGNTQKAWRWWQRPDSRFVGTRAAELLGLDLKTSERLFHSAWRPHDGLSVPDALRKIGEGAAIEDVSA